MKLIRDEIQRHKAAKCQKIFLLLRWSLGVTLENYYNVVPIHSLLKFVSSCILSVIHRTRAHQSFFCVAFNHDKDSVAVHSFSFP